MRYSLLTVSLALAFGAACGPSKPAEHGKKAPVVYRKVVSLTPSATEIVGSIYSRVVLGRSSDCDRPGNVKGVPVVYADGSLDVEQVKKLQPECIVYDKDELPAGIVDQVKALGVPTYVFGADTVDAHLEQVFEFGRFSEAERLGSRYADKVLREREIALANANENPVRVCFVRNDYNAGLQIAGTGGFLADVIRSAGAAPVGPQGSGWLKLEPKLLAGYNPEVMIVSGTVGVFATEPAFSSVSAVKAGHLVGMDSRIVARRGDRVDNLIKAVTDLAKQVR